MVQLVQVKKPEGVAQRKKFKMKQEVRQVTTPIYYVNGHPHIGHAYTTIVSDFLVRYHRMQGQEVSFSTGTDEHGQKIAQEAAIKGETEQEFVDKIAEVFKDLCQNLDLSTHSFVRTTDPSHKAFVQLILQYLYKKGDIVKGKYQGLYCVPCEAFFTESQVKDGNCPDCQREVQQYEEVAYFFKMSKYIKDLEQDLKQDRWSVWPQSRKNEALGAIALQPEADLCISRPKKRLSWGIEFPFDRDYVTYVWFDALLNYYSVILSQEWKDKIMGYDVSQSTEEQLQEILDQLWASQCFKQETKRMHLIGKDILRPHAIYWPCMLKAMNFPMPHKLWVHGWWTISGDKMSKSKNNVVTPRDMIARVGVDGLRYFLLREIILGDDGVFSEESLIERYHSDLGNDLGNLVSRVYAMAQKYFPEGLYQKECQLEEDSQVDEVIHRLSQYDFFEKGSVQKYLEECFVLIRDANRKVDYWAPYKLYKQGQVEECRNKLYTLVCVIRAIAIFMKPAVPRATEKIKKMLGYQQEEFKTSLAEYQYDMLGNNPREILFPRIDTEEKS